MDRRRQIGQFFSHENCQGSFRHFLRKKPSGLLFVYTRGPYFNYLKNSQTYIITMKTAQHTIIHNSLDRREDVLKNRLKIVFKNKIPT
jgi:hypothetical protein